MCARNAPVPRFRHQRVAQRPSIRRDRREDTREEQWGENVHVSQTLGILDHPMGKVSRKI